MTQDLRVRVISFRDEVPEGYEEVDTTSRSRNWTRELSPFVAGPVRLYGGYSAYTVENGYQFSKVYMPYVDFETGDPNDAYWEWAKKGWGDRKVHRYPMGKGAVPEYLWWEGEKVPLEEAKIRIYVRLYHAAVKNTYAFKRLCSMVRGGEKLALRCFEGYDHKAEGLSYREVFENTKRKAGHGFVLALMLDRYLKE